MKRTLILLACAGLAAPSVAAERRYSVTDFDRIVVEGPFIVRLATGRSSSAVASGGQNGLDRLSMDVSGQTLRIRRNRNSWGGSSAPEGPLTILVGTRRLRSARVIGPGRLEIDRIEGLAASLTVEGSGHLSAGVVRADNLSVGLAGGGRIELAGTTRRLTADIQGSGDVAGADLRAEDAFITSATSGTVAFAGGRAASVNAFGLGQVVISGRPACTVRGPSAAQVRCGANPR